jgi:cation:H+ antiporter
MEFLLLLGGLVLLALGGEALVRGAVQLAERMGVSPLLIGLTLVGFGTSTPELVTSVQAALIGSPGIAVGNAVGSNIANILLILGIAALISPVRVGSMALKRDGVLVLATAAVFALVGFTLPLDRLVGLAFVAGLVGYLVYAWRTERAGADGHPAAFEKAQAFEGTHPTLHAAGAAAPGAGAGALVLALGMALGGLVLVVFGGRLLVDGAVALARNFGIEETVIGLTIVAVGTSMPELVTSLVAAVRRQSDVALGNILGSNIYNILGILGLTALIAPTAVPAQIAWFDNLVMVAVSAALLAFAWTGLRIGRREGGALLAGYLLYVWWIWPV